MTKQKTKCSTPYGIASIASLPFEEGSQLGHVTKLLRIYRQAVDKLPTARLNGVADHRDVCILLGNVGTVKGNDMEITSDDKKKLAQYITDHCHPEARGQQFILLLQRIQRPGFPKRRPRAPDAKSRTCRFCGSGQCDLPLHRYTVTTVAVEPRKLRQRESDPRSRHVCDQKQVESQALDPHKLVLKHELTAILERLLVRLPPRQQQAILARADWPDSPSILELAAKWRCTRQYVYEMAKRAARRIQYELLRSGYQAADCFELMRRATDAQLRAPAADTKRSAALN